MHSTLPSRNFNFCWKAWEGRKEDAERGGLAAVGVGVSRASQVNEVIRSQETQEIENEKYEKGEKRRKNR